MEYDAMFKEINSNPKLNMSSQKTGKIKTMSGKPKLRQFIASRHSIKYIEKSFLDRGKIFQVDTQKY